jgi:hypothetical protein
MAIGPASGERYQLVAALLSSAMVAGAFVDAWFHFGSSGIETFLTPSHALLYAGYVSTAGWLLIGVKSPDTTGPSPMVILGIALFPIGGIADFIWHEVRGFETGFDVPISPPHLLLVAGGWLMASQAIQASSRTPPGTRVNLSVLVATTACAASAAFPLLHLNAFTSPWNLGHRREVADAVLDPEGPLRPDLVLGLSVLPLVLTTTLLLGVPLLFITRRWRLQPGSVTTLVGGFALLTGIARGHQPASIFVAVVVATATADVALIRAQGLSQRGIRVPAKAVTGLVGYLWVAILLGAGVTGHLEGASAETWLGSVMLCLALLAILGSFAGEPAFDDDESLLLSADGPSKSYRPAGP